jgi:hypothetical protein
MPLGLGLSDAEEVVLLASGVRPGLIDMARHVIDTHAVPSFPG